jgi:glycosyltransferase involved in cell wall biosynthesis
VPPGVVDALRQRLGLASSTRVVLGLGRLRWEKGFDILIEAAARLSPWPDVRVVIVGDGPEGATLRQRAARIDPPVLMPGHMADVQPWLALASLVVMPSRRESFGQVTLETMATGLPLVATAVGGLQDVVVDGVTGLLVPPDDPQAMADAVRALLVDPERATTLGAAARRRYSERYTIEHMADGWMAAWQRQFRSHEVAA